MFMLKWKKQLVLGALVVLEGVGIRGVNEPTRKNIMENVPNMRS